MRIFYRFLRFVSAITLFFFCWTYLSVWQVAAFAVEKTQGDLVATANSAGQETHSAGEQFEKTLESIRDGISKAEEKSAKGQDSAPEIETVKAKKAEIDGLDDDLRKEFAATEKQIRDRKLPSEILDRHAAFVKHYNDNLAELKANVDAIGKARSKTELAAALQKAKSHLEKEKARKKHVPLDPNKLPHRTVKAKERAPRLKQEEFEREFGKQKSKHLAAHHPGSPPVTMTTRSTFSGRPLMLAYNSTIASDMPLTTAASSLGQDPGSWASLAEFPAFTPSQESGILTLAAADAPTSADLAETIDVQFTPEIRAKAQELGYNPAKIYEWVRNNVDFVPTYGSIQGADMCLQTKQCNAFDTASLLIALLRASNIPARYALSTVEIPIEKVMNWVGGVTDPKAAGTILASNGIPAKLLMSGNTIKTVQLEHVWVRTFVDYIPSRGAVQKQSDTWVSIDASYKQYSYTKRLDTTVSVPFDASSFVDQIRSTATINEAEGYVTKIDPLIIKQQMADYQLRMKNYITQNHPNSTVRDVFGDKTIISQEVPIIPVTLPYRTVLAGTEFSEVPSKYRAMLTFSISDPLGFGEDTHYAAVIPAIAGKKITLSYEAATASDAALLKSYGGNIAAVPAYLLNLRPSLKIAGNEVMAGPSLQAGATHDFTMVFSEPGLGTDYVNNQLDAGGYSAIVLETQRYTYKMLESKLAVLKATLETIKSQLDSGQTPSAQRDSLVGDWLWLQGIYYFYTQGKMLGLVELISGIAATKGIAEAITSVIPRITYTFSIPSKISPAAYGIDVDRDIYAAVSKTGDTEDVKRFITMSGYIGSSLEHFHTEAVMRTPGLSAISILNAANKAGIPVYTITKNNLNAVLPKLQLSSEVISDITNAINAGKTVTTPQRNLTLFEWTGTGYIVRDPNTGAAAYMISGGANGGYNALLYCLKDILMVLYGLYPASTAGLVVVGLLNWVQSAHDAGAGINWTSDSMLGAILDILLYIFIILMALVATWLVLTLSIAGLVIFALVLSLIFGFLFNLMVLSLNASESGQPEPPMWCALPCAPAIADAYHYWFDDGSTYDNPCY